MKAVPPLPQRIGPPESWSPILVQGQQIRVYTPVEIVEVGKIVEEVEVNKALADWNPQRHNATDRVALGHGFNLLVVFGLGQQPQPVGGKFTTRGIEGAAIGSAQVSAEGVDGDNEGPSVRLELCEKWSKKRKESWLDFSQQNLKSVRLYIHVTISGLALLLWQWLYLQDRAHQVSGGTTNVLTKRVERLQICLLN